MNEISFTIVDGLPPFSVELLGSNIKKNVNNIGQHTLENVPIGVYTLVITDSNGCVHEEDLIVNPSVTTTTTTVLPGNSIVVGNTQDDITVFNTAATNRNSVFTGYPDADIITLYLWFRTFNGGKFDEIKTIDYDIRVINSTADTSTFEFISLSDEINTEVIQNTVGPTSPLSGNIIFKKNFIETYFEFIYYRGNNNPSFNIELNSSTPVFYTNIETRFVVNKMFGINNINQSNIDLNY